MAHRGDRSCPGEDEQMSESEVPEATPTPRPMHWVDICRVMRLMGYMEDLLLPRLYLDSSRKAQGFGEV